MRVEFYVLSSATTEGRLRAACQLARLSRSINLRIAIPSAIQSSRRDICYVGTYYIHIQNAAVWQFGAHIIRI